MLFRSAGREPDNETRDQTAEQPGGNDRKQQAGPDVGEGVHHLAAGKAAVVVRARSPLLRRRVGCGEDSAERQQEVVAVRRNSEPEVANAVSSLYVYLASPPQR